jgi:hypothetical protein
MQLLCQILVHLEDQDQVVFREPARAGSRVSMLFCIVFIPTFVPVYSGVLILSNDIILTRVLLLKRDFLFNHATCLGWLQRKIKGVIVPVVDRCSEVVFDKFGRISSQLGGISSSTGQPPWRPSVFDGRALVEPPHTNSDQSRVSGLSYHLGGERERLVPRRLCLSNWL